MEKVLPIVLTIGIFIVGILSIPLGSVPVPLEYIFSPEKAPEYMRIIIFNLRLPRIVMDDAFFKRSCSSDSISKSIG